MLAAGDLAAANNAHGAECAITAHQALPMPFERARTQLRLGQLQRRQRQKEAATTRFHRARLHSKECSTAGGDQPNPRRAGTHKGVPDPSPSAHSVGNKTRRQNQPPRTPTNRDIAAVVFIGPKTVEANLAPGPPELGIHTRAELRPSRRPANRESTAAFSLVGLTV